MIDPFQKKTTNGDNFTPSTYFQYNVHRQVSQLLNSKISQFLEISLATSTDPRLLLREQHSYGKTQTGNYAARLTLFSLLEPERLD